MNSSSLLTSTRTSNLGVSSSQSFQQTYHQRIKLLLKKNPNLATLDGFLDAAVQFLPLSERRSRFDIEVVHVLSSGKAQDPQRCSDQKELNRIVDFDAPTNRISTFIFVEDLSYDVIEHLGITYDLPPEFFALHVRETESYRTGVWAPRRSPDINWLSSYIAGAPFYSFKLRRYYYFPGGIKEVQKLRSTATNVPRAVWFNDGLPNSGVVERVTIYTMKDSEGRDIGIILTDRTIKQDIPLGYAYPLTCSDLNPSKFHPDRNVQVPLRREFTSYLLSLPPSAALTLFSPQVNPLLLLTPLVNAVACYTTMFLADTRACIHRVTYPLPDYNCSHDPTLNVYRLRRVSRSIDSHRLDLESNQRIIRTRAPHLADELCKDLEILHAEMSLFLMRLENDVQYSASILSIEQTKLVNNLAKIGILFVPMTTVAAVLSIPDPRNRFAIFGAVTVPFVLVLSLWLFRWPKHSYEIVPAKMKAY